MTTSTNTLLQRIKYCCSRLCVAAAVALCSVVLVGSKAPTTLETIEAKGYITMISRSGPTTYYQGAKGLTGYEYRLGEAFAEYLGVELRIKEENNLATMLNSVGSPVGDFAASGLTITHDRSKLVRFASPYLEISQQLLYRNGSPKPTSIDDLLGKNILVVANSAHSERLHELSKQHPQLRWKEQNNVDMIDLIEQVNNGDIDYTIVDSNAYDINRALYPNTLVAFDISEPQQLAWAFAKQTDRSLYNKAEAFFQQAANDGTLADLKERFYGHVDTISMGGALTFIKRLRHRLPKWEQQIKLAADQHLLDWKLLAAVSYQESHWNPRARSHTGVRGMMMLTRITAKEMGIKNRLDAEQSLDGGARYLNKILSRIPERIQGPDRTWLALAAYNVGYGHMEDARILTERMGGNPDKWADVREHLPLLAKRQYYKSLRYGYARGWEPVSYVENIRNFYQVLAWNEQVQHRRLAALDEDIQQVQSALNKTISLL